MIEYKFNVRLCYVCLDCNLWLSHYSIVMIVGFIFWMFWIIVVSLNCFT